MDVFEVKYRDSRSCHVFMFIKSLLLNLRTVNVNVLRIRGIRVVLVLRVSIFNNPFVPNESFLFPLKTSENLLLFLGEREGYVRKNGLMS